MPKDVPQPVNPPQNQDHQGMRQRTGNEPLSGSKKVKNRNHSRNNHGEGS